MASKIRIHELARELGLTNKETLELSDALGIGAKSHSSSMEEAQADRVRRKAEREGLIREPEPEAETKPAETAADTAPATKDAAPKKSAPAKSEAKPKAVAEPTAAQDAAPRAAAPRAAGSTESGSPESGSPEAPATAEDPASEVTTPERAPVADSGGADGGDPDARPADHGGAPPTEAAPPAKRVVTSSGKGRPPRPEARPEAPAAEAPTRPSAPAPRPPQSKPQPTSAPPMVATAGPPSAPVSPKDAPLSSSGKPIPPPPHRPTSLSGKPIPPPPGLGGRGPAPVRAGGPARPGGRPSGGGGGRAPMGAPPRTGPAGAGRPGGGPGGGGRPGGGPGGRPGGPPGRRPPQRRRSRRRRNREELQPLDAPSYTPDDAPVPEGQIVIERASSAQELAPKLNRTAADVIRFLLEQGEMVTATQSLSDDMIELFAAEVSAEVHLVDPGEEQEVELRKKLGADVFDDEDDSDTPIRPPVITVMGHVDHGKTKLLDRIRSAHVAEGEAGGITQHIGAYQVSRGGRLLTFIDTPGHEAFTAMRARGADATDIVVLVVAADDGVMPQTIEAISHAKAAEVPIVVAINKIDRENADPTRVLTQLAEHDLVPEAWGGETIVNEISALENIGIDELLESLFVVADVEDLHASPEGRARGVVLESNLDVGRGPVATVLVQRGTLRVGEPAVAGAAVGRVRALLDDRGEAVTEAGPSTPVVVLGLSEVAEAGDEVIVAPDEKTAKNVASQRGHWHRVASIAGTAAAATSSGAKLEDLFAQIQAGEAATLALIVKADVTGSLGALTESLTKLERDDVKLAFVHKGVGAITEGDIQLAATTGAIIIGFNVRPDRRIRELAADEDVEIRTYEIIYKLLEDVESAMLGMLAPEIEEIVTGDAEVREIFRVPRIGAVAGCLVQSGRITRGSKVRFLREGTIIWKGEISSLKRFAEDVTEVRAGYECGIGLSDFQDLKAGDVIETYDERVIART
ncbi:MAG TPA: translation initiation factor IF-2 [Acidimicrobiales bacterium]|nr:translation initiation factor IF-2 [Acidimicrobiales bacterium]